MPDDQAQIFADAIAAAAVRLGSQNAVAREIGFTPQNLSQLLAGHRPCPPTRVLAVERVTGVGRSALRPDLHPPLEGVAVS